jgi:hypothetical protein
MLMHSNSSSSSGGRSSGGIMETGGVQAARDAVFSVCSAHELTTELCSCETCSCLKTQNAGGRCGSATPAGCGGGCSERSRRAAAQSMSRGYAESRLGGSAAGGCMEAPLRPAASNIPGEVRLVPGLGKKRNKKQSTPTQQLGSQTHRVLYRVWVPSLSTRSAPPTPTP